jgi:ABC-type transporter Mla MlaB component
MAELLELEAGRWRLEGALTLETVAVLTRQSARLFPSRRDRTRHQEAELELDLAGVTQASSAAVALMLDWLARARSVGCQLRIINWPLSMVRIARFSNLAELLELSADGIG